MAITIPDAAAGDNILTDRNALADLIASALNTIDGAGITAATVPQSALAKGKSVLVFSFFIDGGAAVLPTVEFVLPNLDGASNSTYKFLGYSVCAQTLTAPDETFDIQKNGGSMLAAPVNFNTLVAGMPTVAMEATPDSLTSGDVVSIVSAYTAGTISSVTFALYLSVSHVGT